jgi:hypothetical protein
MHPRFKFQKNNMVTFKTKIKKIGRTFGLYISRSTTDQPLLDNLVLKLKPINCGIDLIRIGGDNDGGYLIPNDLEGVKFSFSPGVSNIANFEYECLERGIPSFLADYSVNQPPIELKGCQFLKKFVGSYNNVHTITLEKWISESLPKDFKEDLILQMDIEGAEYETLLATPFSILEKFRIMVVEFHHFHNLDNKEYYNLVNATIEKIRESFSLVHLHPNNFEGITNVNGVLMPSVIEATFLRKDRVKLTNKLNKLPHLLDQPNNPDLDDIILPLNWNK